MGRGLSDLQKTILRRALTNRRAEGRQGARGGADVVRAEILADYWGWEMKHAPGWFYQHRDGWQWRALGGQHFSARKVGSETYNSAQAALTRAFLRLERRGLVTLVSAAYSNWSGVNLSEPGIEVAKGLSVKSPA